MTNPGRLRHRFLLLWGAACAACLFQSGCSDPRTNAGIAPRQGEAVSSPVPEESPSDQQPAPNLSPPGAETAEAIEVTAQAPPAEGQTAPEAEQANTPTVATKESLPSPPKERVFAIESEGALRVGFDDLDLLKVLKMDPVTPDCVEKMPGWLRGLSGKKVRIRGFMKPSLLLTGIPQFMFVRDTGLCCFGPKGKIYDMIAVTLKPGVTTDYIDLRPFDVVGTFKIEMQQLDDDGTIYGLYYIDDAVIVQK